MKRQSGLTEKRMNNRRFRKTEEAILQVVTEGGHYIGVEEMAKQVGVARSTIYAHHRAVKEIVPDYRNYLLRKFNRMLTKLLKRRQRKLKEIVSQWLIFMLQNKKYIIMLSKCGDKELFSQMIQRLEPELTRRLRLPKNSRKMYLVFTGEMAELASEWVKGGMIEEEIGEIAKEMTELAETMRTRLAFLLK